MLPSRSPQGLLLSVFPSQVLGVLWAVLGQGPAAPAAPAALPVLLAAGAQRFWWTVSFCLRQLKGGGRGAARGTTSWEAAAAAVSCFQRKQVPTLGIGWTLRLALCDFLLVTIL